MALRLAGFFLSPVCLSSCVPTVLNMGGTGISTSCPSATAFALALGPDLPWADQLDPGNLRHSAYMILTYISLLIPAFSLLIGPRSLSVPLRPYRMLLYHSYTPFKVHNLKFMTLGLCPKPRPLFKKSGAKTLNL